MNVSNSSLDSFPSDPSASVPDDRYDEDRALISKIRSGNEEAFGQLVRRYAEPLYRFAYFRLADAQLAEDVVQDLFAHLWYGREQLDIYGNVESYLFRSVRNRALDLIRRQRSQDRIRDVMGQGLMTSETTVYNAGEQSIEAEELAGVIRDVLLTLPPRTREIFMLRRDRGMSYSDIANTLSVGLPTVRNQVSRATQAILVALQRWRAGA